MRIESLLRVLAVFGLVGACSSSSTNADSVGGGGSSATGGSQASGGTWASGASAGSAGSPAGGTSPTGGVGGAAGAPSDAGPVGTDVSVTDAVGDEPLPLDCNTYCQQI